MSASPYPAYRTLGVEWLENVPSDWKDVPLRTLFKRVKRTGFADEALLSVYRDYGVIDKSTRSDNFNNPSEDLSVYQLVCPGDLAINKMKAWQGSVAISNIRGIVSPAYFIFRPTHDSFHQFLHYLFRSNEYVSAYALVSKGVRINQWDLAPEQHASMKVILPSYEEQRQIAAYLDRETGQIDDLITKQEQLVATLTERRQAVITQAVTRGLDPDIELRDSHVPWLGLVPIHWTVSSLGHRIAVISGFPFKSEQFSSDEENVRLMRGANINPGKTAWNDVMYWKREPGDGLEPYELSIGDLVLGLDRPIVSAGIRVAAVEDVDLPALLLQRVARIRPSKNALGSFVFLLLTGQQFHDYLAPIFTGVSVPHMSPDQLRKFTVAFPPVEEQAAIVDQIRMATQDIDALVKKACEVIDLLRERRQALISAAVTGKIDVRGL